MRKDRVWKIANKHLNSNVSVKPLSINPPIQWQQLPLMSRP